MNNTDNQNQINHPDNKPAEKCGKKMTSRRIFALIGVVILVLMYLVTLIAAITDSSATGRLFALSLYASIALPILIWVYSWLIRKLTDRKED